jgi:hypothetical protein
MSKLHALAFAAVVVSPAWIAAQQPGTPPATEKVPVTDSYHGVSRRARSLFGRRVP